ncbi:aldehyde dehydrogenase family protein [Kribbella catacumbae]|uniref:aldehyde dehydrogenase family protein n=1 Tax=Kribbella catacumbae TaxID=460086 RepID=UPI0003A6CA6F|nr:aldehyde dehydrogenase family protein [Kribbella catacumbae]
MSVKDNFIDGSWQPAQAGAPRTNVNPANLANPIGEFAESGAADVKAAIDSAYAAAGAWRELGPIRRGKFLTRAHRLLGERAAKVAAAVTREQGKRLSEAAGEVDRAPSAAAGAESCWVLAVGDVLHHRPEVEETVDRMPEFALPAGGADHACALPLHGEFLHALSVGSTPAASWTHWRSCMQLLRPARLLLR